MCVCVFVCARTSLYTHPHTHIHIYTHIYIYIERERERERCVRVCGICKLEKILSKRSRGNICLSTPKHDLRTHLVPNQLSLFLLRQAFFPQPTARKNRSIRCMRSTFWQKTGLQISSKWEFWKVWAKWQIDHTPGWRWMQRGTLCCMLLDKFIPSHRNKTANLQSTYPRNAIQFAQLGETR